MAASALDDDQELDTTGALARAFLAERERWPLWIPVGLGLGIALYFSLTIEPAPYAGAAAIVVSALTAVAARRRLGWLAAAMAMLAVSAGFTAAQLRVALVDAPILAADLRAVGVSGRVVANEIRGAGQRLVIDHPRVDGLDPTATPERLRITLRGGREERIPPGRWLSLRATLSPPSGPGRAGSL